VREALLARGVLGGNHEAARLLPVLPTGVASVSHEAACPAPRSTDGTEDACASELHSLGKGRSAAGTTNL
jgi:hypothetical protein